jgi:hypothetical protein
MEFLTVGTADWRTQGQATLNRAANERKPILFNRAGKPTFVLFPIPFLKKAALLAELRRLELIRQSYYEGVDEDPLVLDITKPPPRVQANWIRREMLRLRSEITWSVTPKVFTKYDQPIALLLPIPHDMDEPTYHKIAEEFYA